MRFTCCPAFPVNGQEPRDAIIDGVHVHYRSELRIRGLWRLLALPGVRRAHQTMMRGDGEVFRFLRLSLSNYVAYRRLGIEVDVIEASTYPSSTLLFALFRPRPLVLTAHSPGWQAISRLLGLPMTMDEGEETAGHYRPFVKVLEALTRFQATRAAVFAVPSQLGIRAYDTSPCTHRWWRT